MNRKSKITTLLACVFGLVFSMYGSGALATIIGSDHDLQAEGWGSDEICAYCHTPHNAVEFTAGPLWDRELTTSSFAVYTSPLNTLDAGPLGQPTGASKLCLGCHDGSVAMENFGGVSSGTNTMEQVNPLRNFGTDLSNDHPISFAYADAEATDTQLIAEATVDGLGLLISGDVECASCHDVHNNANAGPFLLRVANSVADGGTASGLCLSCHDK